MADPYPLSANLYPAAVRSAKLDAPEVRAQNLRLLLSLVWFEGAISRSELARRTGMSRSTTSVIAADIVDMGLAHFTGAGRSSGGRRPVMLGFRQDALALAGVDLGRDHVGVALMDLRGRVLAWRRRVHPSEDTPDETLALVEALVRECLGDAGLTAAHLAGVGVGLACPVDRAHPDVIPEYSLPSWSGYDVPTLLGRALGCRVEIDNDANFAALGELWWGAGRQARDMTFVTVGLGIGGAHIVDGDVYRGAHGLAGELGHVVIDIDGPACTCGLDGCLATRIGTDALLSRTRSETRATTIPELVDAALAGEAAAVAILRDAGRALGVALASFVNAMNPASIILGGELTRAGALLTDPVHAVLARRVRWVAAEAPPIARAELGDRGVAIGAATFVLKTALADPSLFPQVPGATAAPG